LRKEAVLSTKSKKQPFTYQNDRKLVEKLSFTHISTHSFRRTASTYLFLMNKQALFAHNQTNYIHFACRDNRYKLLKMPVSGTIFSFLKTLSSPVALSICKQIENNARHLKAGAKNEDVRSFNNRIRSL